MMTQSSLCTGTQLLGFRWVGDGLKSHLRTEDDMEEAQQYYENT